jgi:hypothetical protein
MPEKTNAPDPSSPERNPLGLGPRDAKSSNTGSVADTSYDAVGSDPYASGEPRKDFDTDASDDATAGEDPRAG